MFTPPEGKILRNRARCKLCNDIIESLHRHDYQTCSCGEIMVDGGRDYLRGGAKKMENFEPLHEYAPIV
jgi:hypothetical protein